MKSISRREFFKKCVLAAGSSIIFPKTFSSFSKYLFADNIPELVAASGISPSKNTREAIRELGGIGRFVTKGATVMIKPNIGWARTPEQAANTNPEVVAELVKLCVEAGAKKVKVTDYTCNHGPTCFSMSGIEKAAKAAGAEVFLTEDFMFTDMDFKGEIMKLWPVNREITDADVLINVPVAKDHGLAKLTLGMKNWFGAVGGNRGRLHQNINQTITDMAAFFKPELTVIDATRILLRHGPTGGNLEDVKETRTVIASADPVAADSYAAGLFGIKPEALEYIVNAHKRGLGKMDISAISIKNIKT